MNMKSLWHKHPGVRSGAKLSMGERAADAMRNGMGSWPFVFSALTFLVIWISGNHDEFLRKYTPIEIGNIKVVDEFIEDGIWYCHGDKFDGIVKMRWLGMLGSVGYDLAIVIDRFLKRFNKKTSLSKFLKDNVKAAVSFLVDFENEMVRQAKKRKCHTVVCGHIHTPNFKLIDGVYYLNCGDWVENCTHVILTNNSLELWYPNN